MLGVAELGQPLETRQIPRDLPRLPVMVCKGDEGVGAFCMAWGCLNNAPLCVHLSFPLPSLTTRTPLPGAPAPGMLIPQGTCTPLFPGGCLGKPIVLGCCPWEKTAG